MYKIKRAEDGGFNIIGIDGDVVAHRTTHMAACCASKNLKEAFEKAVEDELKSHIEGIITDMAEAYDPIKEKVFKAHNLIVLSNDEHLEAEREAALGRNRSYTKIMGCYTETYIPKPRYKDKSQEEYRKELNWVPASP